MKSRWLHLLITIFIIFSYMQFEYVRYCMECDAGYQEYSYALPETDYYRVLAAFSKNGPLKKRYPRQAGKPKRNPL